MAAISGRGRPEVTPGTGVSESRRRASSRPHVADRASASAASLLPPCSEGPACGSLMPDPWERGRPARSGPKVRGRRPANRSSGQGARVRTGHAVPEGHAVPKACLLGRSTITAAASPVWPRAVMPEKPTPPACCGRGRPRSQDTPIPGSQPAFGSGYAGLGDDGRFLVQSAPAGTATGLRRPGSRAPAVAATMAALPSHTNSRSKPPVASKTRPARMTVRPATPSASTNFAP